MKIFAKKKVIFALTFLCALFYFAQAFPVAQTARQAPEPQPEASIHVKDPYYNFGEVIEGTEVQHEFTVRNTGKQVLKILRVQGG